MTHQRLDERKIGGFQGQVAPVAIRGGGEKQDASGPELFFQQQGIAVSQREESGPGDGVGSEIALNPGRSERFLKNLIGKTLQRGMGGVRALDLFSRSF